MELIIDRKPTGLQFRCPQACVDSLAGADPAEIRLVEWEGGLAAIADTIWTGEVKDGIAMLHTPATVVEAHQRYADELNGGRRTVVKPSVYRSGHRPVLNWPNK